ncbi:hypothetical protein ACWDTT_15905 [Streptosporangium sandarakinum]
MNSLTLGATVADIDTGAIGTVRAFNDVTAEVRWHGKPWGEDFKIARRADLLNLDNPDADSLDQIRNLCSAALKAASKIDRDVRDALEESAWHVSDMRRVLSFINALGTLADRMRIELEKDGLADVR